MKWGRETEREECGWEKVILGREGTAPAKAHVGKVTRN